jgi:hypothetical protein
MSLHALDRTMIAECIRDGLLDQQGRPTDAGIIHLDNFLRYLPARMAICDVMIAHRELSAIGFDSPTSADFVAARSRLARDVEPFERVVEWLQNAPRIKTPGQHSYWTKHQIGRQIGTYVSQGVLIAACLHLGINIRPQGTGAALAIPLRELRRH